MCRGQLKRNKKASPLHSGSALKVLTISTFEEGVLPSSGNRTWRQRRPVPSTAPSEAYELQLIRIAVRGNNAVACGQLKRNKKASPLHSGSALKVLTISTYEEGVLPSSGNRTWRQRRPVPSTAPRRPMSFSS